MSLSHAGNLNNPNYNKVIDAYIKEGMQAAELRLVTTQLLSWEKFHAFCYETPELKGAWSTSSLLAHTFKKVFSETIATHHHWKTKDVTEVIALLNKANVSLERKDDGASYRLKAAKRSGPPFPYAEYCRLYGIDIAHEALDLLDKQHDIINPRNISLPLDIGIVISANINRPLQRQVTAHLENFALTDWMIRRIASLPFASQREKANTLLPADQQIPEIPAAPARNQIHTAQSLVATPSSAYHSAADSTSYGSPATGPIAPPYAAVLPSNPNYGMHIATPSSAYHSAAAHSPAYLSMLHSTSYDGVHSST